MAIFVNENTKVLVQGLTGGQGRFHGLRNRDYGTQVVAGVTPGKAGQDVEGIPMYDTVDAAVAATGATASFIAVPPKAAPAAILEAARARDRGEDVALTASMCKYFASEMCGRVADRCVQMFGGAGYIADFSSIERYYRDVRLFRLYEGTSQIHQLNIAKLTLREHEKAAVK